MKLYVDDDPKYRPTPEGWTRVYTAEEAILMLDHGDVEEISLDHDLGDQHDPEETGYTVLLHIESRVVWDEEYQAPKIKIHTANSSVYPKMEAAVVSIKRFMKMKTKGE